MVNLKTRRAKLAAQRKVDRMILALMLSQSKPLKKLLDAQYNKIASQIEGGNRNINLNLFKTSLAKTIKQTYTRTGTVFSNEIFKLFEKDFAENIEQKSLLTEFWKKMRLWINNNTANQVKEIQNTTKKKLKNIIRRGLNEGLSSTQIARNIRDKTVFNLSRARSIARTEVHNAAVSSIDFSMDTVAEQNLIEFIREWVTAGGERVRGKPGDKFNHRAANGQRRLRGKAFNVSGERLMRPGDSSLGASIGNIILCRCILIYHTIKRKRKAIINIVNQLKRSLLANQVLVEE